MKRLAVLLTAVAVLLVPTSVSAESYNSTQNTLGQTICPIGYGMKLVPSSAWQSGYEMQNHVSADCTSGRPSIAAGDGHEVVAGVNAKLFANGTEAGDTGGLSDCHCAQHIWTRFGFSWSTWTGQSRVRLEIQPLSPESSIKFAGSPGTYGGTDGSGDGYICTIGDKRLVKDCTFTDDDW